jgi:hypothetical protein
MTDYWRLEFDARVLPVCREQGMSRAQVEAILNTLASLKHVRRPERDRRMAAVRCTRDRWYRFKPYTGARWRAIIEIEAGRRVLVVHLILLRNQQTYKIVEAYFRKGQAA